MKELFATTLEKILRLQDLNVKQKLTRLIIFFLAILTIIVFYSSLTLYQQKHDGLVVNIAGRQRMLTQKFTKEFFLFLQQISPEGKRATSEQMDKTRRLFEVSLQALARGGKTYKDLGMTKPVQIPATKNRQIAEQIGKVRLLWQNLVEEVDSIRRDEASPEQLLNVNKMSVKTLAAMNKAVGMLADQADNKVRTLQIVEVIMWLLALISAWIISTMLVENLTQPLTEMVRSAHRIAGGDLKQYPPIKCSRDEIGVLAGHVERMRNALAEVIRKVMQNSRQMAHSSCQIASISKEISDVGTRQRERSSEVLQAIDSLQEVSGHVDKCIAEAKETVVRTEQEAESGIATVEENIDMLAHAVESVHSTAQEIESLDKASGQIHTIIESIQNIADQTNLLALNATIEAARAGDAGKGFAVVANEIKELAKQTADSTDEITSLINHLTGRISGSVVAMRQVVEEVNNSQERSKETVQAFQTMREGIDQTTEGTDQIEALNRRQAEQLELLRTKLDRLFGVLEESLRKSESTTLVAEDMYDSSEELNSTLEKFTLDSLTELRRQQGDQRTHPRIRNHLQVDVMFRGETIQAMTNDLSLRGMSLKITTRLDRDQEVQALLHLPVRPGEPDQVIPLRLNLLRERKSGNYFIYGADFQLTNKGDEERLKRAFAFFRKPHAYQEDE